MLKQCLLLLALLVLGCTQQSETKKQDYAVPTQSPFITILGIAQDAGFPQANCKKDCCKAVWSDHSLRKMVSCLGLVDPIANQSWLFDATPDFKDQLQNLEALAPLAGIFLTHAHIGHYTGLMHLGREAMGAKEMPVYSMYLMQEFLESNGPWSQLVELKNIKLVDIEDNLPVSVSEELEVIPIQVPHRSEFSETVGFIIAGPEKRVLFIPDIDKWEPWNRDIIQLIREVDYAILDGTFFQNGEIPGRDMSTIPHPFIEESMNLFADMEPEEKAKVHFIHFNHTNPVLQPGSPARAQVEAAGFNISEEGAIFAL